MFFKSVLASSLLALTALAQNSTTSFSSNSTATGTNGIAPLPAVTSTLTTTVINGVTVTAPASPLQTVVVNGITVNIQIIAGVTFVNGVAQVPVNPNAGSNPLAVTTIYRTVVGGTTTVFNNVCACPSGAPALGGSGSAPGGGAPGSGAVVPGSGSGAGVAPGAGSGAAPGGNAGGNAAIPGNGVIPAGANNVVVIAPGVFQFTVTVVVVIPASVLTTVVGGVTRTVTVEVPRTVTSTVTSTTTAPAATGGNGVAPLPGAASTSGIFSNSTATGVLPGGSSAAGASQTSIIGATIIGGSTVIPGSSATAAPSVTVVQLAAAGTPITCSAGRLGRDTSPGAVASLITIDSTGILTCNGLTGYLSLQQGSNPAVYDVLLSAPPAPAGTQLGYFSIQNGNLVSQLSPLMRRKRQSNTLICGLDNLGFVIAGSFIAPGQLQITFVSGQPAGQTTSSAAVVAPTSTEVGTISINPIGLSSDATAVPTASASTDVPVVSSVATDSASVSVAPVDSTTAPVVESTTAPVVESTTAPVVESTTAPVIESTTAPVAETTTAPVVESTTAPVIESTTAPVAETTTAPVVESTTAPVAETTTAPVVESTTAPVIERTTAPATTAAPSTTEPASTTAPSTTSAAPSSVSGFALCASDSPRPSNIFAIDANSNYYDTFLVSNGILQSQNLDGGSLSPEFRFNPCAGQVADNNNLAVGYYPVDSLSATGSNIADMSYWSTGTPVPESDIVFAISQTGSDFTFGSGVSLYYDNSNNQYKIFDNSVAPVSSTATNGFLLLSTFQFVSVDPLRACTVCPPP